MLTGKQKRFLRSLGQTMEPIVLIGKGEITPNLIQQVNETLEAREFIKVKLLQSCAMDIDEVAEALAGECNAEIAQTIGKNVLLYRRSETKPKLELPE